MLIMKNLPSLSLIKGNDANFCCIGKVILENIPSLTEHGILLGGAFWKVRELTSSNADSLDRFIRREIDRQQRNVELLKQLK